MEVEDCVLVKHPDGSLQWSGNLMLEYELVDTPVQEREVIHIAHVIFDQISAP